MGRGTGGERAGGGAAGEVGEQGSDIGELWGEAGRYSGVETEEEEREWAASVTPKRRGEMAEAAFVAKASRMGFGVAKPWGDSDPYDLIVDTGEKLRKVQVKSA